MISDNILKWYTDEIIRSKYNVLGWSLIEKQIKEDKTDKKEEDNPDEVDKTDEIEEEKPKKRGRKPKIQNRDEE